MTALAALLLAQSAAQGERVALEGTVVDALTGQPVKGALVQVRPVPFRPNWPPDSQATTDASGKFRIENLIPGRIGVFARHDRYPPIMEHPPKTEEIVTLESGGTKDYRLKIVPGAAISGRVVDEDGEPMPFANVDVVGENDDPERSRPYGQSGVNDRGEFRIANVPTGRYRLRVRANRPPLRNRSFAPREADADFASLVYPLAYHPPQSPGGKAQTIEVQPGMQLTGIEIRLTVERAVPVSGQVSGYRAPANGPGLSLTLRRKGTLTDAYFAYSQPDGKFRFSGVRPGSYDLTAMSQQTSTLTHFSRQDLEVGDKPLKDVSIEAKQTFEIAGTVEDPKIPGLPLGKMGSMQISLNPIDAPPGVNHVNAAVLPGGSFTLNGVVGGALYKLSGPFPYVARARFGNRESEGDVIRFDSPGELTITPGVVPASANLTTTTPAPETGLSLVLQPLDEREKHPRHWVYLTYSQPNMRTIQAAPGRYRVFAVEGQFFPYNVPPELMFELVKARGQEVEFRVGAAAPQLTLTPFTRAEREEVEKKLRQ